MQKQIHHNDEEIKSINYLIIVEKAILQAFYICRVDFCKQYPL